MFRTFSDFLSVHQSLDELFLCHQEALIAAQYALSLELVCEYEAALSLHMRQEEERLLPLFERLGPPRRWPVVLYTGQHQKMRGFVTRARLATQRLLEKGRPDRRQVISILDQEATFKHLVEHHDGAEREGLFDVLDRQTSPADREGLLFECSREWASMAERLGATLRRASEELDC